MSCWPESLSFVVELVQLRNKLAYEMTCDYRNWFIHKHAPSTYERVRVCDELLALSSFSRDPFADVCWAILELDVAGFAAR